MKKTMRITCVLLVISMISALFAGCGKKSTTGESENKGPRVLTVGIPQSASIPDYNSNEFTKYMEEASGIDIQFQYFASSAANYKQQLTLMCTGGEKLPDVLVGFTGMSHYDVNQFGEDGFLIDLTELIEKKAPNYQKALDELPKDLKKYIKEKGTNTNTKEFYAMPMVMPSAIDDMQSLIYINKVWLDKLGLQAPTTTEELYNVAKAFATGDPNGNGVADEMPLLTKENMYNYILNAFVEYQGDTFNVKNGKLWDPITTDEFRQGITFINKLVKEELYNELSFTLSQAEFKNLISPVEGVGRVGIFGGHHESMTNASTNALDDYIALAPLKDATGKGGYTMISQTEPYWSGYITKDCENPELAMEFLDLFYLDETVSRARHGVKDLDWSEKEGQNPYGTTSYVNVINSQAFFDDSLNRVWGNPMLGIMTQRNYIAVADTGTGRSAQASRLQSEQWAIHEGGNKPKESATNLVYTTEEYELREKKANNLSEYISETIVLFMTGEKDPSNDAHWNEFMNDLDKLGRGDMMKIAQDAYNRKNGK